LAFIQSSNAKDIMEQMAGGRVLPQAERSRIYD
jgi:hypothetical protein